jgi:iron complex outermembrane receptor protein
MLGIGIQDSLILFEEVVIVTPALRYTYYYDELKSGQDLYGKAQDGISQNEGYMNPQIGIKVQPIHWLAIKTNLNQYNRIPSFFELFGDRGFFVSNYELKKETGVNFDTGIEINKKIERGNIDGFSANVTYFQSSIDDLITRVYDARGIGKSVNISNADIKGVELGCKLDVFKYFRLTGNATLQDPVNHSKIKGFDGKKLPGQFQRKYLGMAEVNYNQWKLFAEYSVNSGMYYDTANLLKAEDQENVNTGISRLFNNWLVSFEARNITDNQYEDYNGYPMPGISYFLKVKYGF